MTKTSHLAKALRSFRFAVTGGGGEFIARRRTYIDRRSEIEAGVLGEARENPSLFRERACPTCGQRRAADTFMNRSGFSFSVCALDGTIYMDPVPTESTLMRLYNDPAYEMRWIEGERRVASDEQQAKDFSALVRLLGDFASHPRLLDVGCASGKFLAQAAARFDASGVELSSRAAEIARSKGFEVRTGYISDVPGSAVFDVVTMIQFIEHLVDPAETLRHAHRLLKPGGVLYVSTPATDSASFRFLGPLHRHVAGFAHVSLYGRDSLIRAVEQHGFECITHEHWGRSDLAFHDTVSLRISRRTYSQGMALFSPRLYHAATFVDEALFNVPSRLTLPRGTPPYQRALFKRTTM